MLVALALGEACLSQAQMGYSEPGLERHLCWVETTGPPEAESETLRNVYKRKRGLREGAVEDAV